MLDPAEHLHSFLIQRCFSFLPIASLVAANNVSHRWRSAIKGRSLWRTAFLREANYEYGDLRRAYHLEAKADKFKAAYEKALERAQERCFGNRSPCESGFWEGSDDLSDYDDEASVTGSDFSEYTPCIDPSEIADEWHLLCLQHLRRECLLSHGHLTTLWALSPAHSRLRLSGIDSVNDALLLFEAKPADLQPVERAWSMMSFNRHTLKVIDDMSLPPAVSYQIKKDRNIDNVIHRFRRTEATQHSPTIDWVELWVSIDCLSKITPHQKEIGCIPAGAFQVSQNLAYIPGFHPVVAVNIDEEDPSTVQAFSTKYTDSTVNLWIRIGTTTLLLSGKEDRRSGDGCPETLNACRVAQKGSKIEIKAATGGRVLFTLPRNRRTAPPVAVFYGFELVKNPISLSEDLELTTGTVKKRATGTLKPCVPHQYLANAFVSGDDFFDGAMNPTTGVKSWDVHSFKYLEDADCLVMSLDSGYFLLVPTWTTVFERQQLLSGSQRDPFLRQQSILIHVDVEPSDPIYGTGPDYRIGFCGPRLQIYTKSSTLILDCSKITTPLKSVAEHDIDRAPPALEATLIAGTLRDLESPNNILEGIDGFYDLLSMGHPWVEVYYKEAQARNPDGASFWDFWDSEEPDCVIRVVTFAPEPNTKPF